ncbi:MAG: CPBP family glutamic-type intramembrane protease [Chloroflexota bacterium]
MAITINRSQTETVSSGGIKGLMQRRPITSFFVLMFAGLWLGYLPLLLTSQGFGVIPFTFPFPAQLWNIPASLAGPLVAGLVMSWVVGGKQGRHEFVKRLFRFRFGPQWYLVALAVAPVLGILSVLVAMGVAPFGIVMSQAAGSIVSYLISAVLFAVLINLWEESGQIGFALPILQRRHGAVLASLIIAPMWALMHMPALFVPEMGVGVSGPLTLEGIMLSLAVLTAFAIPVRLLATWLFNSVGQSVIVVALFHAAMNAVQGEITKLVPDYSPFYLLGGFAVAAFVLIAITRGKLGYKAEQEQATQPAPAMRPSVVTVVR